MDPVTVANISFPFIEEDRHVKFLPHDALSLTAALEAAGHVVDFRDYQQESANYPDPQDPGNAPLFFAGAGEVVIITTPYDAMPVAILWAERLKEHDSRRTIILGGYGPKHVATATLEAFPFIDAVITGDLEITGPQMLRHREHCWGEVPGLVYREAGRVCIPLAADGPTDLDQLPSPAYDKVDLDDYWEVTLFSSRGCPFRCSFCVRGGKVVEKSIAGIIKEISTLRYRYGRRRLLFYDQTFTLKKNRVMKLCRRLREEGLDTMKWSCTGRINAADIELMKEMADSGCDMIYFGVESGSDAVLKRMKKAITRELAEKVIAEAQRFFFVNTFFIWGFPFESMADFHATVDMVQKLTEQGVAPIVYMLSPLPSSLVYREYRRQLQFSPELWEANWPVHLSNPESRRQVARIIEKHPRIFPGFYSADLAAPEKLRVIKRLGLETHFPDV